MDSKDVRKGKGFGYTSNKGIVCMIRCFKCGKENYAMSVATGYCMWCGHNPNTLIEEKTNGKANKR